MTQASKTNLERLADCETQLKELLTVNRRIMADYATITRDMAIVAPMAEWAVQHVLTEQREKLELDKRLGIKST